MNLLSLELTDSLNRLVELHKSLATGEQILFTIFVKLGPHVGGLRVDLPYGRPCHPGYVRARCDVAKISTDGSASFVQWASNAETDGRALLHFGVPVVQIGMWQITITEKPAP